MASTINITLDPVAITNVLILVGELGCIVIGMFFVMMGIGTMLHERYANNGRWYANESWFYYGVAICLFVIVYWLDHLVGTI